MRPKFLLYLATIIVPIEARAQPTVSIQFLAPGSEIRVWSRQPPLNAWKLKYLGLTDSSIVVAERSGSPRIEGFHNELSTAMIDRIEVNSGQRKHDGGRAARGFFAGTAIGAATGAVGGYMLASSNCTVSECEEVTIAAGLGILGGLTGGLVGAAIGSRGTVIWTQVRIP